MTPARRSRAPRRLVTLFVLLTVAFGGIAVRLIDLQVGDNDRYATLAADIRKREIVFAARRGEIFDRNGEALAISVDLHTIYADPALVDDPFTAAARLSGALGRTRSDLEEHLRGTFPGSRFEYLARQVEPEIAARVRRLDLPGIFIRPEAKRIYPNERLGSHVLGFVDIDGNGLAGVELQYDSILQGEPGRMVLEQDPAGRPLPQAEFSYERARPGRSLFLTIDKNLQYFTELELREAVEAYSATAGSAIVMRVPTGEVLAMANVPTFDTNRPGRASGAIQRNRAVTDVYEPGSAFKIVTLGAALEEGVVRPATSFVVPDALAYSDRVFHDSHPHPPEEMSVRAIIEQSSNVGTIKIGLELGGRRLDRYVRRFGFGARTGLDFPGESPGIVVDRSDWSGSTIATIPIGQGIAVTALQMAAAYATVANEGVWVEPKLLYATLGAGGGIEASPAPAGRRVLSRRTARAMTGILRGVVERGTGIEAQIPGYAVAGKTGTAQKAVAGGYGDSYVASFAGFAPADDPGFVVLVVLDEPSPIWGGVTAAPTFRTIAEYALRYLGVPPSRDAERTARAIEHERDAEPPPRD